MTIQKFLCAYLLFVNLLTFIVFGTDKWKAATGMRRISEKSLLLLSAIGGIIGAWFSIVLFRHKTRDRSFLLFMILISISWLIGIIVFLKQH